MNWGNRLVIVFVSFAAMIITLVYKSMHTRFELVSKDYYKDELRYQEKIDGRLNAATLREVTIRQTDSLILIDLPLSKDSGVISGEAWFYCGSNETKDKHIPLTNTQQGRQSIPRSRLAAGDYQLKLSWKENQRQYYHEANIRIL